MPRPQFRIHYVRWWHVFSPKHRRHKKVLEKLISIMPWDDEAFGERMWHAILSEQGDRTVSWRP